MGVHSLASGFPLSAWLVEEGLSIWSAYCLPQPDTSALFAALAPIVHPASEFSTENSYGDCKMVQLYIV